MDFYYKKFLELQKDFHEALHEYPLFSEMVDNIFDNDIKEINDLLEKQDEFYLKKAISKLENVIKYIKDTSESIDREYKLFDKNATLWEKANISSLDNKLLDRLNDKIKKANVLIKSHDLSKIQEANKLMEEILKEIG